MNGASQRHVCEYMGSWSFHIASWLAVIHKPVLILRYEDLLAARRNAASRVWRAFCVSNRGPCSFARAIEKSFFAALARQEAERGFNERPEDRRDVFPQGRRGAMETGFVERAESQRIVAAHGPMMMRLGYVRRARAVDQHANVVDVLILRHILQMCDDSNFSPCGLRKRNEVQRRRTRSSAPFACCALAMKRRSAFAAE